MSVPPIVGRHFYVVSGCHTFTEAVAEYEVLVPTYRCLGYEVVFLPQAIVAERVAFVPTTLADG